MLNSIQLDSTGAAAQRDGTSQRDAKGKSESPSSSGIGIGANSGLLRYVNYLLRASAACGAVADLPRFLPQLHSRRHSYIAAAFESGCRPKLRRASDPGLLPIRRKIRKLNFRILSSQKRMLSSKGQMEMRRRRTRTRRPYSCTSLPANLLRTKGA